MAEIEDVSELLLGVANQMSSSATEAESQLANLKSSENGLVAGTGEAPLLRVPSTCSRSGTQPEFGSKNPWSRSQTRARRWLLLKRSLRAASQTRSPEDFGRLVLCRVQDMTPCARGVDCIGKEGVARRDAEFVCYR